MNVKEKVNLYFKEKYNKNLTKGEIEESLNSMYYLGRAIHRFYLLKAKSFKQNDSQRVLICES